eukprot:gene21025-14531_t
MLRHLVVSAQLLAVSLAVPQLLSCGDDAGTMLRLGQTIMGQPVGAASSTMRITFPLIYGSAEKVSSFVPGKVVPVEVTGVPTDVYFAIRLGDGGGELVMPTNGSTQILTFSVRTPCDRAPASLNITIVASPSGFGPFYYQSMLLPKSASGGRAANCPPPTPPVCNYPFVEPLTASCPPNGGGMAQYAAPCPDVPCISPPDKNGTCLIITSWPERKTPHANDKSIMAESKVELLTDDVTPASHHYITGSVPPPRAWSRDMTGWQLQVDGEVDRPTVFTMQDLQDMAQPVTRRYEFETTQQADWWSIGGVSCSEWTGVLLKDVLAAVGVKESAVYIGWYGEDDGPSRGIPISAALNGHSMLAWSMNGAAIPPYHGYPLRLLAPGFPGSAQGKWLKRIWVRDREHDGLGMLGKSYRVPIYPLRPGDFT